MQSDDEPLLRHRKTKSAQKNPWYCLATAYGEQAAGTLDAALADKNRDFWNQWIQKGAHSGLREEIERVFELRTKGELALPHPETTIDFSDTHFDRLISFAGFTFPKRTTFRRAHFSQAASFYKTVFSFVEFDSAEFDLDTYFVEANLLQASFSWATFRSRVDFESTRFGNVRFNKTAFDFAMFKKATFSSTANYRDAHFRGDAMFLNAEFLDDAEFNAAEFSEHAYFSSVNFSQRTLFSDATFYRSANFTNARFGQRTAFDQAAFVHSVPDFRGATMHEATEWHGTAWPAPPSRTDAQQQVYAYERLKLEMERLKKHEDEQAFFRKELRARRGLFPMVSGQWLLNLTYQVASDYGNSIARPTASLAALLVICAAIFAYSPQLPAPCMTISPALALKISFANIFVFLPEKREIMTPEVLACWSETARTVSAVQSLLSVALLFLLGLALRNRFRMK